MEWYVLRGLTIWNLEITNSMDFAFFRTLAGQRLEGSQTLLPLAGLCLRQMHTNCRTPKGYGCSGGSHLEYYIKGTTYNLLEK